MPYKDREKERAAKAKYRAAHREEIKAYAANHKKERRERDVIYRNTHREELRASYKKYRAAYHLEEISARKRKDYAEHKDKYRARKLARAYNISMSDYDKIFVTQNGRCAICGCPFSGTPYVDHNHITREVRGLLCSHCNIMLGNAYDSPEILANAIKYLELYKGESRGISTGIQPINPRP